MTSVLSRASAREVHETKHEMEGLHDVHEKPDLLCGLSLGSLHLGIWKRPSMVRRSPSTPGGTSDADEFSLGSSFVSTPLSPQGRREQSAHAGCIAGTGLERGMDELPPWDYNRGPNGPTRWGKLHPTWSVADVGHQQSPINIFLPKAVEPTHCLGSLDVQYTNAPAVLLNNGHTIQVNWAGGQLVTEGKVFKKCQFHFHAPAEHTVNGVRYPLEMHLVHKAEDNQLAVVAVLFQEGKRNEFLAQFWDKLPLLEGQVGKEIQIPDLHMEDLELGTNHYYRYQGSLTTPPCSEGVIWTVMGKVEMCSPESIESFTKAIRGENARPIQPLNQRAVAYRKGLAGGKAETGEGVVIA